MNARRNIQQSTHAGETKPFNASSTQNSIPRTRPIPRMPPMTRRRQRRIIINQILQIRTRHPFLASIPLRQIQRARTSSIRTVSLSIKRRTIRRARSHAPCSAVTHGLVSQVRERYRWVVANWNVSCAAGWSSDAGCVVACWEVA